MLRLSTQRDTKIIPSVHYPQYTKSANSLYCMGKELSIQVSSRRIRMAAYRYANGYGCELFSQLFGNAEEEEPQESDEENKEELAALAQETKALNEIKASMGTDSYPRKVFEKVFTTDINRLLSMEDMWKNRDRKPVPLDYDKLSSADNKEEDKDDNDTGLEDQKMWNLHKCFDMFKDR